MLSAVLATAADVSAMGARVDRTSFFEVKRALKALGRSTRTSGHKGADRLDALNELLDAAMLEERARLHKAAEEDHSEAYFKQLDEEREEKRRADEAAKKRCFDNITKDLESAIVRYDYCALCDLIRRGGNPNLETEAGSTALLRATFGGNVDEITRLIELGARCDYVTKRNEMTPLVLACASGNIPVVEALLSAGANANQELPDGRTPLAVSLKYGRIDPLAQLLVERGKAKVNMANANGDTPMLLAVHYEMGLECIKFLVKHGGDVFAPDARGKEPVELARQACQWTIARYLEEIKFSRSIQRTMALDRRDSVAKKIAARESVQRERMDAAVRAHHVNLLRDLVEAGAGTPDHETPDGETLLIWAGHFCKVDAMLALHGTGANVDYQNKRGTTALMRAATVGNTRAARVLIHVLGADVGLRDTQGRTALMHASLKGWLKLVQLLLAAGANSAVEDPLGVTAIMLAACGDHADIVSVLQAHQARAGTVAFELYYVRKETLHELDGNALEREMDDIEAVRERLPKRQPVRPQQQQLQVWQEPRRRCLCCKKVEAWAHCTKCGLLLCSRCWDAEHNQPGGLKQHHVPVVLAAVPRGQTPPLSASRRVGELKSLPETLNGLRALAGGFVKECQQAQRCLKDQAEARKRAKAAALLLPPRPAMSTMRERIERELTERAHADREERQRRHKDKIKHQARLLKLAGESVSTEEPETSIRAKYDAVLRVNEEEKTDPTDPRRLLVRPVQLELATLLIEEAPRGEASVREGLELAEGVLAKQMRKLGRTDLVMLRTVQVMGRGLLRLGHAREGAETLARALAVCKEFEDRDSPIYVAAVKAYADVLLKGGRFEQTRSLWLAEAAERRGALGRKHPLVGEALRMAKAADALRKQARADGMRAQRAEADAEAALRDAGQRFWARIKSLETFLQITGDAPGWTMFRQFALSRGARQLVHFCDGVRKLYDAQGVRALRCERCDAQIRFDPEDPDPPEDATCNVCEGGKLLDEFQHRSVLLYRTFLRNGNLLGCVPQIIRDDIRDDIAGPHGPDVFMLAVETVFKYMHATLYNLFLATPWRKRAPFKYIVETRLKYDEACVRLIVRLQRWRLRCHINARIQSKSNSNNHHHHRN